MTQDEDKKIQEMFDAIHVSMLAAAHATVVAGRLLVVAWLVLVGNAVLAAVVIAGWFR